MNTEEKLDIILMSMADIASTQSDNDRFHIGYDKEFLSKVLGDNSSPKEIFFLENKLRSDGFIEALPQNYFLFQITHKGINFAMEGGYVEQSKNITNENKYKRSMRQYALWTVVILAVTLMFSILFYFITLKKS